MAIETGFNPNSDLTRSSNETDNHQIHESDQSELPAKFEPVEEFERVKSLHGKEGLEALEHFRSQRLENKEELAYCQEDLIRFIRENPNLRVNDLLSYALCLSEEHNIPNKQQKIIFEAVEKYTDRHKLVERLYRKHMSPKELYESLFNKQPLGDVEVIKGPMTLYIKCFNLEDFAYIDSYHWLDNKEVTLDERKAAQNTIGLSLEDFDGVIILENSSLILTGESQSTHDHEEQHAINRLFEESTREVEIEDILGDILAELMIVKNEHTKSILISKYFRIIRSKFEERASDEILAWFAGGKDGDYNIVRDLTMRGGLYDFTSRAEKYINRKGEKLLTVLGESENEQVELIRSNLMGKEYDERIVEGIQSIRTLEAHGYSKGKIIGLLLHTPLADWTKLATQLPANSQKQ